MTTRAKTNATAVTKRGKKTARTKPAEKSEKMMKLIKAIKAGKAAKGTKRVGRSAAVAPRWIELRSDSTPVGAARVDVDQTNSVAAFARKYSSAPQLGNAMKSVGKIVVERRATGAVDPANGLGAKATLLNAAGQVIARQG